MNTTREMLKETKNCILNLGHACLNAGYSMQKRPNLKYVDSMIEKMRPRFNDEMYGADETIDSLHEAVREYACALYAYARSGVKGLTPEDALQNMEVSEILDYIRESAIRKASPCCEKDASYGDVYLLVCNQLHRAGTLRIFA